MSEAFAWGVLASSSLLVGALLVLWRPVGRRTLGLVMAFGAGVLISAVAYELVGEAIEAGGLDEAGEFYPVALGLAAGAGTFYVGDLLIDRMGGEHRKRSTREGGDSSLALTLGIVLDGIPESVTLGLTLVAGDGISAAMLAAVFLSNLPESMAASTGFARNGRSAGWIVGLWLAVMAVSGVAAMIGYSLFDTAGGGGYLFVLAFAGGAVLTMLADTMMPEAHELGGRAVGLLTTLGFAVAVFIVALEGA